MWAAGFLEGEGSFSGSVCKGRFYVGVTASQTATAEPLERLQGLFGGRIHIEHVSRTNSIIKSRDQHRWGIHGARARGVMMTIYKFMSSRRKAQIRRCLERDGNGRI